MKVKTKGKIDFTKIPKGHTQHQSGAGVHKNWRKENRTHTKAKLRNEE